MENITADLADGLRRLNRLNIDMSETELREEVLLLRELLISARKSALEMSGRIAALADIPQVECRSFQLVPVLRADQDSWTSCAGTR